MMVVVVVMMMVDMMNTSLVTPGDIPVAPSLVVAAPHRSGRDHPPDCDGELQPHLAGLDLAPELHRSPPLPLLLVEEAESAEKNSQRLE